MCMPISYFDMKVNAMADGKNPRVRISAILRGL